MADDWKDVQRHWAEIRDLDRAQVLVAWDQEVTMPPGGHATRAHTLAALAGVLHERRTARPLANAVERLHRRRARLPQARRRAVDVLRREIRKARCIPPDLARDLALAESRGLLAWREARAKRDWKRFQPSLTGMVALKRRVAKLSAAGARLYDALLDDYEPGATMKSVDPLLAELRDFTSATLRRIVQSGARPDNRPLTGRAFPVEAQRAFVTQIVQAMGLTPERRRLDISTHPFCSGIAPDDVRMTSRFDPRDLRGGLFGAIHEAGHGLYEAGLDPRRVRAPLGGAVSMALHESQSRLWENQVARSRPFWQYWLPRMKRAFPSMKGVSVDAVWRGANAMRPSMIRVEADELTYNLHIILRYEIERDLIEGRQDVAGLPARWNDGMAGLLGIRPAHDAEGVLQDIHWAVGLFGYFPTYSLGNLYAAQFLEAARRSIRGLDARIAKGDLAPLREWLRENIHRRDRTLDADTLCRRVTGSPLGVDAFARAMRAKVRALYGV
jgi:carboxypeptidase Taq